jgi:oxygen-independent coproporphyrinogen-3 oxidase
MPSALPEGEVAPADGVLPSGALAALGSRPFGFYVHVPFCTVRCGYCDFNTYTAQELGSGVSRATYVDHAVAEVRLARGVIGDRDLPVETVFLGGGTPTLLPAAEGRQRPGREYAVGGRDFSLGQRGRHRAILLLRNHRPSGWLTQAR